MSGIVLESGAGYSGSEQQLVLRRSDVKLNGSAPAIMCIHGHGGDSSFMVPAGPPTWGNIGYHAWQLALSGYILFSIDAAGKTAWADAAEMTDIDAGYAWITARAKPKIGLMAWSMGGAASLNWIKRNAAKVGAAWLFNPATDLDFFNATAGYVPSYNTNGVALGAYASEIQADFNPYTTASVGYRIHDEPQSWRGLGVPIVLAHTLDDATIPVGQTQSFVSAVNDPNVSYRQVTGGGHGGSFAGIPTDEIRQFFKSHL